MAEKRIIEFNTATPTNNDYFLMDNQQDGCRKVALNGLFGNGKLTVNGASGSQVEVGASNNIGSNTSAVVVGNSNYISGGESVVVGDSNSVSSDTCVVIGTDLTVGSSDLLVMGQSNIAGLDTLIVIGNGHAPTQEEPYPTLSNLLTLDKYGNLVISGGTGNGNITISGDITFESTRDLSEELDKYKYVTLQNTLIETTDWSLEVAPTYGDYPYVANIDVTSIVTTSGIEYTADIIPSERMISDGLLFSLVTTTATAIKIYASDVPQINYVIPLITLRALRGGTL